MQMTIRSNKPLLHTKNNLTTIYFGLTTGESIEKVLRHV